MTNVTPKEARQARAWLQKRGISSKEVPPRTFAATAKSTGKTFSELLRFIGRMLDGGQGMGESPIATRIAGGDR